MTDEGGQSARGRRQLTERDAELTAIDAALTELCDTGNGPPTARRGGLLVYAGPAGSGKTTLLGEVRKKAAARGCTVLSARGGEQEHHMAFHVVRQLVQPVLAAASEEEHRRIMGSWYDIVAPAVGLVAAEGVGAPDPTGVRDGLDWLVTRFAVRYTPCVLILDDAHWTDPETLSWLAAFAPRAEELPMLVVLAYRPDELPPQGTAFRKLAERNGSRPFDLLPLTPGAVGRIVHDSLGAGADEPFRHECWAVTGGNPFEVVELLAKVRDRGLKPQQENISELRELASAVKGSGLITRIERLGTSAVRLAYATAVLGAATTPALAARIAALGGEEAADAIDRLRVARILTGGTAPDEPLDFVHPLIATSVYRSIPGALRTGMHGEAAVAVVEAGLGAAATARHLQETPAEGDPWVVTQLREAAREYLRSGAPEAARRCLARALREPPPFGDRAAVLFELGCSSLLAEPATTVNHLRSALEQPDLAPALREAITYRLAQALGHSDRMAEAAQVVAQEARQAASAKTRLRMQAEQFMWNAFRADEADSPVRSRRLAKLADHLTGRGLAERYILGLRGWDAMVRGEPAATALKYADQALGDGLSWTDDNWGFEVPVLVALTYMYCDQPGQAELLFTQGIAECERKGWRGAHLSFGFTLLGYIRYRRGRLAEAEDLVQAGLRIANRVGSQVPAQWFALGILIEIQLARGRVREARQLADTFHYGDVVPNAVVYPDSATVYTGLLLAEGLRQDAEQRLTAVGARFDARGMRNPAWCPWQLNLSSALALADPERAAAQAAEALTRARQFGTESAIGQALLAAAEVASGPEELNLLTEAVRHLERSPAAYDLARGLVAHGSALRRAGLPQDAADQLYRGLEDAVHCGADSLAARARDELSAAGLRPLPLRYADTDGLTAQERAVAEHAARGQGTAAIAGELGINERTVNRLLSAACRKVGTDQAGLSRALAKTAEGRRGS